MLIFIFSLDNSENDLAGSKDKIRWAFIID